MDELDALILFLLAFFGIWIGPSIAFASMESIEELRSEISSLKNGFPPWLEKIITWYDEGQVSEKEVINALEFLRDNYNMAEQKAKLYKTIPFKMTRAECLENERYDEIEKICMLDCDKPECAKIYEETKKKASAIFFDAVSFTENNTVSTTLPFYLPITIYKINGNEIISYENYSISKLSQELADYAESQELQNDTDYQGFLNKTEIEHLQNDLEIIQKLQNDTDKHYLIWNNVARFVPKTFRSNIELFLVGTDNENGEVAGVVRDLQNQNKWGIRFDIRDMYQNDTVNENIAKYAVIHEFGHILTESTSQVSIEYGLIDNGLQYDSPMELWEKQKPVCSDNFMTDMGCTKEKSYMNRFYQDFWSGIYPEYVEIWEIKDFDKFKNKLDLFYNDNKDRFVSKYAMFNPEEDIAESWSAFVLNDKPKPNTIANKKMLFFYDYPEFVKLREVIRNRL